MAKGPSQIWSPEFYQAINPTVNTIQFQNAAPGWVARSARPRIVDFDFWYVIAGRGKVLLDGEWVDFVADEMVCIRPGQHYEEERADASDPFQIYFIHLWPFGDARSPFNRMLARRLPTKLSFARHPAMKDRLARLFEAYTIRRDEGLLEIKALALRMLESLFAMLRRDVPTVPPPAYDKLVRAHDFITRNHTTDLTLDQVAERVDLSASYLSALFRQYYGCSPIQYLLDLRLQSARLLLARGGRIGDVAAQAGFHSLHYFSRVFRSRTGLTPTAFAERCRRK